jgi:hypothetical protein
VPFTTSIHTLKYYNSTTQVQEWVIHTILQIEHRFFMFCERNHIKKFSCRMSLFIWFSLKLLLWQETGQQLLETRLNWGLIKNIYGETFGQKKYSAVWLKLYLLGSISFFSSKFKQLHHPTAKSTIWLLYLNKPNFKNITLIVSSKCLRNKWNYLYEINLYTLTFCAVETV